MSDNFVLEEERKTFDAFITRMWERFEKGREKYGFDYLAKNQLNDIEEELLDVANYAFLFYMKMRLLKCLKTPQ
jgi:hypothetical protein